tara:strand:- start:6214 stop:6729 length:516 start_codon:yes stop_codon:yes gene_type:complete
MSFTDIELKNIFTTAPKDKEILEVVSIKAAWFSQDYHLQGQVPDGIEVTLDTAEAVTAFYAPLELSQASSNADLSQTRSIVLQQINDIIASEVDNYNPLTDSKPYIESRAFVIYEDETISAQKQTTITMDLNEIGFDEQGAQIGASSKLVDESATGELATVERNPLFRGLI